MKKYAPVLFVLMFLLSSLACSFGYEGVVFSNDEEVNKGLTATAFQEWLAVPQQAASTPEPTRPPLQPQEPVAKPEASGPSEYAVAATNFDCTCKVDGNVTVEFNFVGDQLEVNSPGSEVIVYDKIAENTYRRSWMGYYILESGEGDKKTETKVDEERSVVIILSGGGYVMEHYQGSSASPCCFHTFTNVK
jgi:hypothetical protein